MQLAWLAHALGAVRAGFALATWRGQVLIAKSVLHIRSHIVLFHALSDLSILCLARKAHDMTHCLGDQPRARVVQSLESKRL